MEVHKMRNKLFTALYFSSNYYSNSKLANIVIRVK